MSDVDEAWVEHLLRVTAERLEGARISEEEAARLHREAAEFGFAQAWEREFDEEHES